MIDLALKLGIDRKKSDMNTRILVVEVEDNTVGMIVDSATEVMRLSGDNIQPAPEIITNKIESEYIEGVGIIDERLLILLDFAKVLGKKGSNQVKKSEQAGKSEKCGEHEKKEPQDDKKPEEPPANKSENNETSEKTEKPHVTKEPEDEDEKKPRDTEQNAEIKSENKLQDENDLNVEDKKSFEKPENKPKDKPKSKDTASTDMQEASVHEALKDVHEDFHFKTHEGKPIKNVHELLDYIKDLDEETFKVFVDEEKNDFYSWIKFVIKDDELADKIQHLKSKNDVTKEIMKRILDLMK